MSNYMQQFVEEMVCILSEKIKNSYYKEYSISDGYVDALTQHVHTLMDEYFNGHSSRIDLKPYISRVKKARQRKKDYWCNSFNEKLLLPIGDARNPAYHEYAYAQTLTDEELFEKYGNLSEFSLLDSLILSYQKKIDNWKDSPDFLFCAFPFLKNLTPRSRKIGLDFDIINAICDYIRKELNGDINYYSHSYPEELLHYPVFSVGGCLMNFHEDATLDEPFYLASSIPETGTNAILKYIIPMNGNYKTQTSLDALDFSIMNTLVSLMGFAIYSGPTAVIARSTLCSAVFGSHHTSSQMDLLDSRLNKLSAANMLLHSETTKDWTSFSFFDHIAFKEETASYNCELAPSFHQMLLTQRLIPVTNPNYCRLKKKFSKYLLFTIQKERISCYLEQITEREYSYSFFTRFVLFPESNIRKNMNLIQESLDEMAESGVGISSVERKQEGFLIHFLTLTPAEIHDLNLETVNTEEF